MGRDPSRHQAPASRVAPRCRFVALSGADKEKTAGGLTPPEVEEARAWQIALPFKETDREGVEVSSTLHIDTVHLREGDTVAISADVRQPRE